MSTENSSDTTESGTRAMPQPTASPRAADYFPGISPRYKQILLTSYVLRIYSQVL